MNSVESKGEGGEKNGEEAVGYRCGIDGREDLWRADGGGYWGSPIVGKPAADRRGREPGQKGCGKKERERENEREGGEEETSNVHEDVISPLGRNIEGGGSPR